VLPNGSQKWARDEALAAQSAQPMQMGNPFQQQMMMQQQQQMQPQMVRPLAVLLCCSLLAQSLLLQRC